MKNLFLLCIASLFLTGCNTIAGFGKDVEKVGSTVQGAASK